MTVQTAAGCKLYIGSTQPASSTAEYESDTYTEVGEIEDMGEFGDQVNPVTFTSLNDRRTRKNKGTYDAGDMTLTVAFDGMDAGQRALKAALADTSSRDYNIKVTLDDLPEEGSHPTTYFFRGKVMSRRIQVGSAESNVTANISIAINSEITEQGAA